MLPKVRLDRRPYLMRCLKYTLPSTDILKIASEILRYRDSTEVHKSKYLPISKQFFTSIL